MTPMTPAVSANRANSVGHDWAFEKTLLRAVASRVVRHRANVDAAGRPLRAGDGALQSIHVPARFIGHRLRVKLSASAVIVYDRNSVVARHQRAIGKGAKVLNLDHYLEILLRKPGALPGATALAQARAAKVFTAEHEAFWAAARKAHGDAAGTRALVEVLLLHRHLDRADVLAGISAALFAALDVATGEVYGSIHRRHRATEFKKFLTTLDKRIPADLDVHVICDNYATHSAPEVKRWLARHPRFHFHLTPTYGSWLNQVERWFALLTDKKLRRGTHRSIQALEKDIRDWITNWNDNPKPFTWTKTADEILERLTSYLQRIPGARHSVDTSHTSECRHRRRSRTARKRAPSSPGHIHGSQVRSKTVRYHPDMSMTGRTAVPGAGNIGGDLDRRGHIRGFDEIETGQCVGGVGACAGPGGNFSSAPGGDVHRGSRTGREERCPAPDHRGVLLTERRILSHVSACSAAVQSTSDVYVSAANCGMTAPTTPGPVLSPIRRTRRPDSDNSAS